ncbi:RDD family protein [Pseudoalteromonas luteoviolacea]|uniref:RDD family protein n=1 Tax=Pseudoalteromonas luteoviolacea TaxID=43657 RepID=UPI001B3A6952|nr:RDD family protein [Pseudoalteromonas luteoviolacea]MBQ4878655.1 RDD family protein [Pseudoalteromonas luteoviolacea]MBQ4907195.1 RDD family protein [Pseudoalteromonas luteoviolacea]
MNKIENEHPSYVGFWARFGASLIDTVFLMLLTVPLIYMIYGKAYWQSTDIMHGTADFLISYILPLIVVILFWLYKSATPGKMVIKAKIVDEKTGENLSKKQSIIRYVAYYISMLPFGLGFFWVAWDAKKQGFHDKIAGTVVVRLQGAGE